MEAPKFTGDIKNWITTLVLGSASLQGLLYLSLDDDLSIFKSGSGLSIIVITLYCLIPGSLLVYWLVARLRKDDNRKVKYVGSVKNLWWAVLTLCAVVTGFATLKIICAFGGSSELAKILSLTSGLIVFSVFVAVFVWAFFVELKSIHQESKVKWKGGETSVYIRSRKKMRRQFVLILGALVVGAIFAFGNAHLHEHQKNGNKRHGEHTESPWNSPVKEHGEILRTDGIIALRDGIKESISKLEHGKSYIKLGNNIFV